MDCRIEYSPHSPLCFQVKHLSHELSLEKGHLQEAKKSLEAKRVHVLDLQSELEQLDRWACTGGWLVGCVGG